MDFILQNETISAEEKSMLAKEVKKVGSDLEIALFKLERTEKVKRTTAILLEETIEELEQKRKAVEMQNRELEIESSLERVRTVAMGMRKKDDMLEVCSIISQQSEILGIKEIRNVQTAIIYEEKGTYLNYEYYAKHDKHLVTEVEYKNHKLQSMFANRMLQGAEELFYESMNGKEVQEWYEYQKTTNQFADSFLENAQSLNYYFYSLGPVALGISSYTPLSDEEINLFKRFRNVFDMAYRRFLDIEKAEFQARESQIELALERVRARTMAMVHSNELAETVAVMFEQFKALGEEPERMAIEIVNEKKHVFDIWATQHGGSQLSELVQISLDEPHVMKKMYKAWKEKTKSITIDLQGNELEEYFQFLKKSKLPVQRKIFGKRRVQNVATFSKGILTIITPEPRPQETIQLLERFAAVFDGTYTRFFDLQNAEAQAREGQIEGALERVRSTSLAMYSSMDLSKVVFVVFTELVKLDALLDRCLLLIVDPKKLDITWYLTGKEGLLSNNGFLVPDNTHPSHQAYLEGWRAKRKKWQYLLGGDEKQRWDAYGFSQTGLAQLPDFIKADMSSVEAIHLTISSDVFGCLIASSLSPLSEAHAAIVDRFTSVFNQAYTRFLDLQKAEAQAREAKIEAAMEKIRSCSMAMQKPEELIEVAEILRREMGQLGVEELETSSIYLVNEDNQTAKCWYAIKDVREGNSKLVSDEITIVFRETRVASMMWDFYTSAEEQGSIVMTGNNRKEWINYCAERSQILQGYYGTEIPARSYHLVKFNGGYLGAAAPDEISAESWEILKRATSVFSLAYTRFNDLQKSEINRLNAVRQASLDRVRAEIASMRTTSDLERIQPLIWNELKTLDVPFVRCGVFIMNDEMQLVQVHLSSPEGKSIAAFNMKYEATNQSEQIVRHWRNMKIFKDHMDEATFAEYTKTLVEQGAVGRDEKYVTENRPTDLYLHFLPFIQGMLYVGNNAPLKEEELQLVQNLADAFSTAYARYEDFNKLETAKLQIEKTLEDLKLTQAQLVQSEKMASLGELTAGIAHEIQNPLNFVNNFSEVSSELVDEMNEELDKGNVEDAKEIATDLKQNLEKITHHGKRAGDIVKGMLQHSRTSSGQKELTDLNVLADEYLRLAYHGLRAKDKSFNADFKTDLDPALPKVNVIPQDLGRVLLNLINNAFYAVQVEMQHAASLIQTPHKQPDYKPTVTVSTKKKENKIEISVKDNGNGIPEHIKEKIFQPFFTTKPTGQGTGLGLSLSYDIVKAHGGELKVETKEGEGCEFIIQLPNS